MAYDKGDVIKHLNTIDSFADSLYGKNLITDFAVWAEINVGVFTAGRTDLIQLDFLQGTLTGGCLLGLGSVGGESGNEFLQLFDLFFLFLVGFFHLFDHQLA